MGVVEFILGVVRGTGGVAVHGLLGIGRERSDRQSRFVVSFVQVGRGMRFGRLGEVGFMKIEAERVRDRCRSFCLVVRRLGMSTRLRRRYKI